jgi:hypothetical protein
MGTFGRKDITIWMDFLIVSFEIFFVLSLAKKFLTDFKQDGETKPIKDLKKIAKNYFDNGFIPEFIMIVPFFYIFQNVFPEAKLFFFFKTFRLVVGLKSFNVSLMMDNIKDAAIEDMEKRI